MSEMKGELQFELNEIVYHKLGEHNEYVLPAPMLVIGRRLSQDTLGVMPGYLLRSVNGQYREFEESELVRELPAFKSHPGYAEATRAQAAEYLK